MNDKVKEQAGIIYNVVESVILGLSVCLLVWLANVVIAQGNVLATHGNQINVNSGRLSDLENHGSRSLESHVKQDDSRVEDLSNRIGKIEIAVISLQSAPGELKALNIKIDGIKEGQVRMEKVLDQYINKTHP